jgi:ABC-type Fe3+-hydroxamate transport system substrate-binding protein
MADDERSEATPTRRQIISYGAAAGGGLLAGCTGNGGDAGTDPATETEAETATDDGSYTASIAPTGTVSFETPPETVFTRLTHHADMAFALGHGDDLTAMHAPDYYDGLWNQFVERLPGVTLDWTGLYSSWEPSKEKLYDLDSDLHLADPAWVTKQDAWDPSDIEEIERNVAPWFGNSLSDRHAEPADGYAADYEYYTLWEQFERVATVFGERARYRELASIHAELQETIEARLPPEGERPSAVMLASFDLETIYAYTLSNPGFLTAHTRPFGARDAFEGAVETNSVVDFETLLEADPDVVLLLGGFEPGTDLAERREAFRSDPVAAEITAVQDGRMYPQGARYQGPILNLFQLEMTAKQLYPDAFGEWPEYESGPYPEIPADERLFDRERVAAVVRGEL